MSIPSDSVRIVLYSTNNVSLFVALSEADDPNNLQLPGGKFEGDESPDQAAARELGEELGVTPEQVNLRPAGELLNDDGISRRYIYVGTIDLDELRPSAEIHHTELLTADSIPEGKNRGHMLSAVLAAQATLSAFES